MARSSRWRRAGLGLAVVLAFLLAAVGVAGNASLRQSWPTTNGTTAVPGLGSSVTVLRDAQGVPQIYADSPADLFRAQGYVAAQDRFFQMDLWRHVTAGRLAELVGSGGVSSDKLIRTMGWRQVAEQELPMLALATRQYLQAYADGVNAYIQHKGDPSNVSLEYAVLGQQVKGYKIDEWSAVDSLAWLKAMAWDLSGNVDTELERARLATTLDPKMLAVLYPTYPAGVNKPILSDADWQPGDLYAPASIVPSALRVGGTPTASMPGTGATGSTGDTGSTGGAGSTGDPGPTQAEQSALIDATRSALSATPHPFGTGEGIGSNSWVVDGKHSSTGKPLLANDPHLGTSLPGIWSQVGLHCRTVSAQCPFDVTGFTFAGFPGVVIGHNAKVAWGFTNLDADVEDLYLEKVTDTTFLRDGKQVPLTTRQETLKVAGADPVTITVRSTGHGPLISDVDNDYALAGGHTVVRGAAQQDAYAVALQWTALTPRPTADAIFSLDTASSFTDFRTAAQQFAVPAQNMIYADTSGKIGYQAPGVVPVRKSSVPNTAPGYWASPGWDSQFDWSGYVPFEDLPWTYNPPEGMIVTANNEVTASATPFLTTEWDSGFRAQRIRDLLTQAGTVTPAQMAQIQMDTRNPLAPTLVPALQAVDLSDDPMAQQARNLLAGWDYTQPVDDSRASQAAAYFNDVYSNLLQLAFDDQLPNDLWANGNSRWMSAVTTLLGDPTNPWWDDVRTPGVIEGRDEVLRKAMQQAAKDLTSRQGKDPSSWRWGSLHTLTLKHPVFGNDAAPAPVQTIFDRGPIALPGGSSIVDANGWDASVGFAVTAAPSMRMVVDLGSLDSSRWVNATGQSGHAYDPHYVDQVDTWATGGSYPWPSTKSAVESAAADTLTLTPPQAS